jgi:hypothetical protein
LLQIPRIDPSQVEPISTVLCECVKCVGGDELEVVEDLKLASQLEDPRIAFLDRFACYTMVLISIESVVGRTRTP